MPGSSRPVAVKAANEDGAPSCSSLSQQEAEVISLLAKGKDAQEVANILQSDEAAVKAHIKSVLGKLNPKPYPGLMLPPRHMSRE